MNEANSTVDSDDAAQLARLGYPSSFERSMSLWENFALGFTYVSPVVGAYMLLGLGLRTGGPPMAWSYVIAGTGMMMVCLVFGEVVSQFPISGGVYPWARRLVGRRWSWMTGWIYGWALYATIAGVAVGAASFLGPLLNIPVTATSVTVVALVTVGLATFFNLLGTRVLAKVALVGFTCEIKGALVVGGWLLAFHRLQPLSVFITNFGFSQHGSFVPAFLAACIVGTFCCFGFEACGDLAEETPDPGRRIPKAMRMTIYIGIGVTLFSVVGLVLAIPDMQAAVAGQSEDPVGAILIGGFGSLGYKVILCVVLVSFVSCVLSLQAAASRLLYAYARDRMIIGSSMLARVSKTTHVPTTSLLVAGAIPALIICLGFLVEDALEVIVSFAAIGIYVAFQMVVVAAMYARCKGWCPCGRFVLGPWAWPVNLLALTYGVLALANLLWPRLQAKAAWYVAYGQPLTLLLVVGVGLTYLFLAKPDQRSNAPAGDAHQLFGRKPAQRPSSSLNSAEVS